MVKEEVEKFLASHAYSQSTREKYRFILTEFIRLPDLPGMDAVGLLEFIENRKGWGNSYQWVALCACRKYLAWRFGSSHAAIAAKMKRTRARRQRCLTAPLALNLLASFDPRTPKGARDLAICALGLDTGLRCSEFCHLQLADMDLSARLLQVITKGGQWGIGVYSPQTAQYIGAWISLRKAAPGVGELFVSTRTGQAMTRFGLNVIVRKWGKSIGIKLCPHDLRRSFATLSTRYGAPSRLVQVAGRWSSIDMVEHYTQDLDPAAIAPFLPVTQLQK
jgi:integrase